jgi:hypothetical protein
MRRRLAITERLFVGGAVGAVGFAVAFIFSNGAMPEAAHGSGVGLVTLAFTTLLASIGIGLILDWVWPKTRRRWHGVLVGIMISQIGGVVMYLTIVPWRMGVRALALTFALLAVCLGAPLGAIHWSPPEDRKDSA